MTFPILMYHEITDHPERIKKIRGIDPEYSLPTWKFEQQIAFLHENRYRSISLDELIQPKVDTNRACLITFDDGYIGNLECAYPILQNYGFTGVVFVPPYFIAKDRYLMNWDQLRWLAGNGFSIQSHTFTHATLEKMNDKEIYHELAESKRVIEEQIGREVKHLSLPYGNYKKSVFALAAQAGYASVFTSRLKHSLDGQPLTFGRIAIKDSYSFTTYVKLINGDKRVLFKLQSQQVLKNSIKRLIGMDRYRTIYRYVKSVNIVHRLRKQP